MRRATGIFLRDLAVPLLAAAACCVAPALIVFSNWSDLKRQRETWRIDGAPCEAVAAIPPRLVSLRRPPKAFGYAGASYVHASGLAYCAELAKEPLWPGGGRFTVCQFNNPGAVTVRTADGRSPTSRRPAGDSR